VTRQTVGDDASGPRTRGSAGALREGPAQAEHRADDEDDRLGLALGQFLVSSAELSAPVITKLTETWKSEQQAFARRDLSGVDYV
jgi:hypothetical protein